MMLKSPILSINNLLKLNQTETNKNHFINLLPDIKSTISNLLVHVENILMWRKGIEYKIKESISISESISKTLELYNLNVKEKKINIIFNNINNIEFEINKNILFTVLRNIIGNAIKYCDENGKVIIDLILKNNKLYFCVKNSYKTINDNLVINLNSPKQLSEYKNKLNRFSGIGLLITTDLLDKNQSTIKFYNENESYIKCVIEFH